MWDRGVTDGFGNLLIQGYKSYSESSKGIV